MTITNVKGEPLAKRELEIIQLLAQAKGVRQMANELGIAEHTVKWYLKKINRKLGTSSRLETILHCIATGIIDIPRRSDT